MTDALTFTQAVTLLDALLAMANFEEPSAADVVVPALDGLQNFGLLGKVEPILTAERRGQVGRREMTKGAAMIVLWSRLVLRDDVDAAVVEISSAHAEERQSVRRIKIFTFWRES